MSKEKLALYGGKPARSGPWPRTYPGAMAIGGEEEQAVLEVLRSHAVFRYYGPHGELPTKVKGFEEAFARYTGSKYTLAVTSGTAAVMTALAAAGIGPGDEVIIPAYTWMATATAVVWNMGIPIIAEVDDTLTLDAADVERKITPRTKAIVPVHMRGAPCNMDRLLKVARKHKLLVVEDTAQANGGSFKGKHLGTYGDLGAFSLQFNKMITTGEGGAVVTNDQERYRRAQMYHDGGGIWRRAEGITASLDELGQFTGVNFRMPELVGAVAGVQLKRLDGLVAKQREIKARIVAGTKAICQAKGFAPRPSHDEAGDVAVCLVYLLPSAEAAKSVAAALRAENISASGMFSRDAEDLHVYYHWAPILKQRTANAIGCPWTCPYYKGKVEWDQESCPKTLDLLARAVHIDITPLLSDEDVNATIAAIAKVAEALL